MEFIGQTALKTSLSQVTSKSIMIYGPKHYGKKTLVRRFYADQGANTYEITGDANDFREALNFIKVQVKPTTYIIPDLDDKNFTIQNMLLKMVLCLLLLLIVGMQIVLQEKKELRIVMN